MRIAARVLIATLLGSAPTACNAPEVADSAPEFTSGIVIQKNRMVTAKEFGPRKANQKGPNCWQLVVKESGKYGKESKVCVNAQTWGITFVGDPFWRNEKYKPSK